MAKVHINEQTLASWQGKYGEKIGDMVRAAIEITNLTADEVWIKFKKTTPVSSSSFLYDMQFRYDSKKMKNNKVKTIATVTVSVIAG